MNRRPGLGTPREMEKYTGISCSSVRRMAKRKGLKQFKRLKTPQMSEGTKNKKNRKKVNSET